MDSISVFQQPVLIRTQIQCVSCHTNVKVRTGVPGRTKDLKTNPFRVCPKIYPESYLEVTSNQAICLAALSCMQATAIPVVLLTNKRRLFTETSGWTPCLYIYPSSFPFWGSIMLMLKTRSKNRKQ